MVDQEEWRPIPGFEGYYEVSTHGRVKSVERRRKFDGGRVRERMMGVSPSRWGHKSVILTKDAKRTCMTVSRAICMAWHGPPADPKLQAAHNDGNASNNHPSNLRWATCSENHGDKFLHGTMMMGERVPTAKLDGQKVYTMRHLRRLGVTVEALAAEFGVSMATISNAVNRKTWKHVA